jgi:hypothetical protein
MVVLFTVAELNASSLFLLAMDSTLAVQAFNHVTQMPF